MSSENLVPPAVPTPPKPPSRPLQKGHAENLADAWENLTVAAHKIADCIKALNHESPDIPAIKDDITTAIKTAAEGTKTLSILYPNLKP